MKCSWIYIYYFISLPSIETIVIAVVSVKFHDIYFAKISVNVLGFKLFVQACEEIIHAIL